MFYIKDDTDLGAIANGQEIKDFKKQLSDSLFCADSKKPKKVIDAKNIKVKSNTKDRNIVYMLASTSGKEINNRIYSDEDYQLQAENESWQLPYDRPVLRNHDAHDGTPVGRVKDCWYISHASKTKIRGNDNLPEDVLNFFKDRHCFDDGVGSLILKANLDDETFARVKDGLDNTVSQGQFADEAICNICGNSYFGGSCNHVAGFSYQLDEKDPNSLKKCIPSMSGLEPAEISIVNVPANDTSLIYVPNSLPATETNNDSKTDGDKQISDEIDKTENLCKDDANTENKTSVEDENIPENIDNNKGDDMFKDLLKKAISDNLNASEEVVNSFNALFDKLETEEQIKALQDFIDATKKEVATEVEDKEENTEDEQENSVEETQTPAEDTTESEDVEKEQKPKEEPKNDFQEEKAELEDYKTFNPVQAETIKKTKTLDSLVNEMFIKNNF
ncbi:hypothetical protein [Fusobacterium necrophorum]|uniref:hypothetical protein n=1 Tax=Fusobacterium necrophorum TaxID=859 RepID=UPI00241CCEF4|nr:hypothetical protein [Fusobacterium necrophorum]MDK4523153.1 hypothetical protein [Fusobacterium necrophorum]